MSMWQIVLEVLLGLYILLVIIINTKKGIAKTFLSGLKSIAIILFAAILTPFLARFCSEYLYKVQGLN